jgi:hypothetical protein
MLVQGKTFSQKKTKIGLLMFLFLNVVYSVSTHF